MDLTKEFKEHNSFIHWFLIAALTGIEITKEVKAKPRLVTMLINGVEINPLKAITRLEEQFDRMVADKAKEQVEEIKKDIMAPFDEQVEDMTAALKMMVDKKLSPTET